MAKPITINEIHNMANALEVDSLEIRLPKSWILLLPLAIEKIFNVANAKVLVFIPPPVEAGEAPIHIKNMINNKVGTVKVEKSMVLKPAVLGVTVLKAVVVILPKTVSCKSKELFISERDKKQKPPTKSNPVV